MSGKPDVIAATGAGLAGLDVLLQMPPGHAIVFLNATSCAFRFFLFQALIGLVIRNFDLIFSSRLRPDPRVELVCDVAAFMGDNLGVEAF